MANSVTQTVAACTFIFAAVCSAWAADTTAVVLSPEARSNLGLEVRPPTGSCGPGSERFQAWQRSSCRGASGSSIKSWLSPRRSSNTVCRWKTWSSRWPPAISTPAVASQPEGESERPIRILGRLGPDAQRVIEDLKRVPVKASDVRPVLLEQVELGTLAETGAGLGPSSVNRENARRRIVIRCNTQGQDASRLAAMMEPITPSLEPQSNNQNRHDQLARLSPLADQERAGRLFNP